MVADVTDLGGLTKMVSTNPFKGHRALPTAMARPIQHGTKQFKYPAEVQTSNSEPFQGIPLSNAIEKVRPQWDTLNHLRLDCLNMSIQNRLTRPALLEFLVHPICSAILTIAEYFARTVTWATLSLRQHHSFDWPESTPTITYTNFAENLRGHNSFNGYQALFSHLHTAYFYFYLIGKTLERVRTLIPSEFFQTRYIDSVITYIRGVESRMLWIGSSQGVNEASATLIHLPRPITDYYREANLSRKELPNAIKVFPMTFYNEGIVQKKRGFEDRLKLIAGYEEYRTRLPRDANGSLTDSAKQRWLTAHAQIDMEIEANLVLKGEVDGLE